MGEPICSNDLTWKEYENAVRETDVGIVPVGVSEQHGLHAPLGADTHIAEEIARRLAERAKALLFPTLHYGCILVVYDGRAWPGAISISAETLSGICTEIGSELARQGMRRIVFVNGHICNSPPLQIAAYNTWSRTGAAVGLLEWWIVVRPEAERLGIRSAPHANEIETSMMLASRDAAPLIDLSKAVPNPGPDYSSEEMILLRNRTAFTRALDHRDVHEAGSYGDPSNATRELGERLIDMAVEHGLTMIEALKHHVRA
ncbi:MAG: creatininase family protein [Chloroflexi bacterium]|nr:creatininase family protein [Chloroflexota bacterium]